MVETVDTTGPQVGHTCKLPTCKPKTAKIHRKADRKVKTN